MQIRSQWWMSALMAASFSMACGSPSTAPPPPTPPPDDVPMGGDVPLGMDVAMGDVPVADQGADVRADVRPDVRPDVPQPVSDPCAMGALTDLSTRMPDAMGVVRVTSNNNSAPEANYLPPPMGCVAGRMMNTSGHQVAFRYRMRETRALLVTTLNPGTDMTFDTVIQVATACSRTAMHLACNDDTGMALQSTARVTTPIMAGTDVFIFVGGYTPPVGMNEPQGAFELSIREIPTVAVGMPCTAMDICAENSACIPNAGSTTMGTCIADGSQGGRCRLMGGACEMGLVCSVAMPTAMMRGNCLREVAAGMDCSAPGTRCAMGTTCRPTIANSMMRTCVPAGAQGGSCRVEEPRCDTVMGTALSCSAGGTCRAQVAVGGACDVTGGATFCAMGAGCAPNMAGTSGTCAANGTAAGTACRDMAPRCNMGLECTTEMGAGTCVTPIPAGMPCTRTSTTARCAAGGLCVIPTGMMSGTCRATVAEMEMNNTPATGNGPVSMNTVFRGAITPGTDVDCFRVTVPMGASITAFTSDANGTCNLGMGADTVLTLHNPMGDEIAENDDAPGRNLCSEINAMTKGASRLMAGTYAVCVSAFAGMAGPVAIPNYYLTINIGM